MNTSYYRFTLNLQSRVSQVSLPVRQGDTGRGLRASFSDGGRPYVIADGCRAVFYARKADGNPLMNDCIIESNSVVRYEFTEQTVSCAGIVECEIRIYGTDGKLIASPRFILVVDERVIYDDDFPISEEEKSALDNIMLVETARADAEAARVEAEALRVEAEEERVTAETERIEAESERITSEEERIAAEVLRGKLPNITETNNGCFLRAVNGKWVAVEVPYAEGVSV